MSMQIEDQADRQWAYRSEPAPPHTEPTCTKAPAHDATSAKLPEKWPIFAGLTTMGPSSHIEPKARIEARSTMAHLEYRHPRRLGV